MSSSNHVSSIMHFQTDGTPETPNPNNMNLIFSHGHRLNFSVQLQYNFNEITFTDGRDAEIHMKKKTQAAKIDL